MGTECHVQKPRAFTKLREIEVLHKIMIFCPEHTFAVGKKIKITLAEMFTSMRQIAAERTIALLYHHYLHSNWSLLLYI